MLLSRLKQPSLGFVQYIKNTPTEVPKTKAYISQFSYLVNRLPSLRKYYLCSRRYTAVMAPEWRKQANAARASARTGNNAARSHNHSQGRPRLTHFLCLPLVTLDSKPKLKAFLDRFKTEAENIEELNPTIKQLLNQRSFRAVGTLHFTLGVMKLNEVDELDKAVQLLSDLDVPAMLRESMQKAKNNAEQSSMDAVPDNPEPLKISLRSLRAMRSPTNTSVLYVKADDETNRLQHFCEALRAAFVDKSLVVEENRPLKLHVTILNSIYGNPVPPRAVEAPNSQVSVKQEVEDEQEERGANEDEDIKTEDADQSQNKTESKRVGNRDNYRHGRRGGRSRPAVFDATLMLDHFKNFEWTDDIKLERIAICKMGADRVCDDAGVTIDEVYEEVAVRELP